MPGGSADGAREPIGPTPLGLEPLGTQERPAHGHPAEPRQRLARHGRPGLVERQPPVAVAARQPGEYAAGEVRRADAVAGEAERVVDRTVVERADLRQVAGRDVDRATQACVIARRSSAGK